MLRDEPSGPEVPVSCPSLLSCPAVCPSPHLWRETAGCRQSVKYIKAPLFPQSRVIHLYRISREARKTGETPTGVRSLSFRHSAGRRQDSERAFCRSFLPAASIHARRTIASSRSTTSSMLSPSVSTQTAPSAITSAPTGRDRSASSRRAMSASTWSKSTSSPRT